MNKYRFGSLFGLDKEATGYYRASERCMAHIRPSLIRIKSETEKQIDQKLSRISEIRAFDLVSHSAKVVDKKERQFFICLMLGQYLYLDEFFPRCIKEKRYYVLAGIRSSSYILSASIIKGIIDCLPPDSYIYHDGFCRVSKKTFLNGVHTYASHQKRRKSTS